MLITILLFFPFCYHPFFKSIVLLHLFFTFSFWHFFFSRRPASQKTEWMDFARYTEYRVIDGRKRAVGAGDGVTNMEAVCNHGIWERSDFVPSQCHRGNIELQTYLLISASLGLWALGLLALRGELCQVSPGFWGNTRLNPETRDGSGAKELRLTYVTATEQRAEDRRLRLNSMKVHLKVWCLQVEGRGQHGTNRFPCTGINNRWPIYED